MSEDDVDDLIGEFVVEGYRFRVVTSHVPTKEPGIVDVIQAGATFVTNFYMAVPHETYRKARDAGNIEGLLEDLKEIAPRVIAHLDG